MKGVIADCFCELVKKKFGEDKLEQIKQSAGVDKNKRFLATENVPDSAVLEMVGCACDTLGISLEDAADAFGEYWVNVYAPRLYSVYYKGVNSSRDFLLRMDEVHTKTAKNLSDAKPPHFKYRWSDDNTLVITYISERGLIDFAVGLIKGVGKYYDEDLSVKKLSDTEIEVVFPST
ncbi:MAG: hypothetical protein B6U97_03770 [Candidatus Altiarchaeales archaeon ex4484_96]|nr:MAG: hypothetical protein B6U97_03770 [Candidatus Altiarchaeales archaeon ex4484_96]